MFWFIVLEVTVIDCIVTGRKRKWFSISDALEQLSLHKPVQKAYLELVIASKSSNNSNDAAIACDAECSNQQDASADTRVT